MLSGTLRSSLKKGLVASARLQSTVTKATTSTNIKSTTADEISTSQIHDEKNLNTESKRTIEQKNNWNRRPQNEKRNFGVTARINFMLRTTEDLDISKLFDQLETILSEASVKDKLDSRSKFVSSGFKVLLKIDELMQTKKDYQVPTSVLYKRVLTLLLENNVLHASHVTTLITELIQEKKFSKALSTWIENVEYLKNNPETFKSSSTRKDYYLSDKDSFLYAGLTSYFLSLLETKASMDLEFVKMIADGSNLDPNPFKSFLIRCKLTSEELGFVNEQFNQFIDLTLDINARSSLKKLSKTAERGQVVYLENFVDRLLNLYKDKLNEIEPKTWAAIMKSFNTVKNFDKVTEFWKLITSEKVGLKNPPIEIWNELLNCQRLSLGNNKSVRVESIWKLLNANSKPNQESYSYYIQYIIDQGKVVDALKLVDQLKKEHPELVDSTLRCNLIDGLLTSKMFDEAYKLFKIYEKLPDFQPTIRVYNGLLFNLLTKNKLNDATEVLEKLIGDKNCSPDVATWTIIVDLLLQNAKDSNSTSEEIFKQLNEIVEAMKENGVLINNASLTMLATNLSRNSRTEDIGLHLFKLMESRKVNFNDVTYTAIISLASKMGDMETALKYYHQAQEKGIKLTTKFYNLIFKGYSNYPDVSATIEFYNSLKSKMNRPETAPNFYTYYFLLIQGIYVKDAEFIRFVITEINKAKLPSLGNTLPALLNGCQENGFELPTELRSKVAESMKGLEL